MSTAKLYAKCLTALEINAALHADAQRFSATPLHWKLIEATDSHHGLSHTTVPVSLPHLAIILHVETGLIAHKSPAVLDAVDPWSLLTAANWGARDVIRVSRKVINTHWYAKHLKRSAVERPSNKRIRMKLRFSIEGLPALRARAVKNAKNWAGTQTFSDKYPETDEDKKIRKDYADLMARRHLWEDKAIAEHLKKNPIYDLITGEIRKDIET